MIATKIIFSNPNLTDLNESISTLFGKARWTPDLRTLFIDHTKLTVDSGWIENRQLMNFVNVGEFEVVNYSQDSTRAQSYVDSLPQLDSIFRDDGTTYRIEQTTIDSIPSEAVPIIVGDMFYLD